MTTKAKTFKGPSPARARVKELAIARLEALTEKQQARTLSRRRRPLTQKQARQLADLEARSLASRLRESPGRQITAMTQSLCLMALATKRKSLRAGCQTACIAWQLGSEGLSGLAHVKETNPAVRSLDRAEALLSRLVWQGAEAQARREMTTQRAQEASE